MNNEEIYKQINKWIGISPGDERVCLLSMCKNWMKHQDDKVSELEQTIKKLKEA